MHGHLRFLPLIGVFVLCFALASVCGAQTPPAEQKPADAAGATPAPAAPMPLGTPAITGPLSGLPPAMFDAGPLGKIAVNGILSGGGLAQSNAVAGDNSTQAAVTNGQVWVQKADGVFQYYFQAGVYNFSTVGVPFMETDKTLTNFFGPLPVGFVKLQAGKNTSFQVGALPTMIGAEAAFSFENMNIQRGLLWNQEPIVSRGIQVNQTMGKVTASLSWNDGYYSNRFNWLSGNLAYTNGPHTISFVAGGNYGQYAHSPFSAPLLQNNSSIYNVIYTFNKNGLILQPYFQYQNVPVNKTVGIVNGGSATGGALLVSKSFKKGFSLAGRWEYIADSTNKGDVDLLGYGAGSKATSFTATPTFQYGGFFFRGDISVVHTMDAANGSMFGPAGLNSNQARAVAEIGFIFGNNIEK